MAIGERGGRARRVGEQIKRELAPVLQQWARDGGHGLVTLTEADVSPDLRQARLFVTALGDQVDPRALLAALLEQAGPLRARLARALPLRVVPRLTFVFDESLRNGARIAALLAGDGPVSTELAPTEDE